MRLANEDLRSLKIELWEHDQRRIKLVTDNFHPAGDATTLKNAPERLEEEDLVNYIGITYNK